MSRSRAREVADRVDYSELHAGTIAVYEASAVAWDAQRSTVFFEKGWIDQWIEAIPTGAAVLDVGCGSGRPIAAYLINQDLPVSGIDAAESMIKLARSRFKGLDWSVMDMRQLSLPRRFGGIIAWDSFFHLNADEQRSTLLRFMEHLAPGGAMLLTIGEAEGEVIGTVNGEAVYHSSLAPGEYEEIVRREGFAAVTIKIRDLDCGEHSILLASGYRGSR